MHTSQQNFDSALPILAQFYEAGSMESFVDENVSGGREYLLTLVSELMDMQLSFRESELVADVLICLMRQVQRDVCISLAEKLAHSDNVPLRLLMHVANEAIDIARPVLRHSTVFCEQDLLYIIKAKPAEYWREIARRNDLTDTVLDRLVDSGDADTALILSENETVEHSVDLIKKLITKAKNDPRLAISLADRPEMNEDLGQMLYETVGASLKMFVQTKFKTIAPEVSSMVDDIVMEVADVGVQKKAIQQQTETDLKQNDVASMIRKLEKGRYKDFVVDMAHYSDLDASIVDGVMRHRSFKGLVVLCKGVKFHKREFLLTVAAVMRALRPNLKINDHMLNKAATYYDTIKEDAAVHLLEQVRAGNVSLTA